MNLQLQEDLQAVILPGSLLSFKGCGSLDLYQNN